MPPKIGKKVGIYLYKNVLSEINLPLKNSLKPGSSVFVGMYKNRDGYYGWFGFGGSVFQWHPDLRIGFAFVPTCLHTLDMSDLRGAELQQIVKECCKNSKA